MLPPSLNKPDVKPPTPKSEAEIDREINNLSDREYGKAKPEYHRWNVSMEKKQFKAFKRYAQDNDTDMAKIISKMVKRRLMKEGYLNTDTAA